MKLTKEKWNQLLEVSQFLRPASVWIKAKRLLNIYTGEIYPANIVIFEDRIAYVGEKQPCIDEKTEIIDASPYILVPGYIEPHTHPFQIYNPLTLAEFALQKGTTTLVHDNLYFFLKLSQEKMEELFQAMNGMPVKNFWWSRLDPQTQDSDLNSKFSPDRIQRTLEHPLVIQAGELTAWKELLAGSPDLKERVYLARSMNKRLEAHNPGASVETLNQITTAGATCCHESISADDVLARLRLGLYATMRYSSIRPDLPNLISELKERGWDNWNRLMLTTDGSAPFFLERGFTDYLIRLSIEAGVPPIEAYRMVTLNPAVYYGLDQELGGIAPGRMADILFLADLEQPTPIHVMANGKMWVKDGVALESFHLDWASYEENTQKTSDWTAQPTWFQVPYQDRFPVAEMKNAVILVQKNESLPVNNGVVDISDLNDYLYVSLIDHNGKWITTGIIKGFGQIHALASTYSVSQDIIVLGKDPKQMAAAVNHVKKMRGGISIFEHNEPIYELGLPLLGGMSQEKMSKLIPKTKELVLLLQDRGYRHEDPVYSILFMSATHLPQIRLTPKGIYSVKRNEILIPSLNL